MPDYSGDLIAARKALFELEAAVNTHDYVKAEKLAADTLVRAIHIQEWCIAQQRTA